MTQEMLRSVWIEPTNTGKYRLDLWDTGRRHARGTTMLGYRLTSPAGVVLFEGEDFSASPMDADDSDESLRGILGFLTLRPGDVEEDYFDAYTDAQAEFARSFDCEAMQLWAIEPDPDSEPFEFEDCE